MSSEEMRVGAQIAVACPNGKTIPMNIEALRSMRSQWFAVRVKSRSEKMVAMMAETKGVETFLPLYQVRRRWSDRLKSVDLPLFPGYVFCRINPQHRLPLLTIPGVLHLVGVGRIPAPIDEREMSAIQTAVRANLATDPWPYLEVGQRVRLEDGPLAGLEGILVGRSKQQRILVSVTLLRRSVAVAIESHWATALDEVVQPSPMPLASSGMMESFPLY